MPGGYTQHIGVDSPDGGDTGVYAGLYGLYNYMLGAASHSQKQTCVMAVSLSQISESMVKCIYNSHTI